MRKSIAIVFALFASAIATPAFAAEAPQFAVGQEWTVRNSPIHVVIGLIDKSGDTTVVHVLADHVPCRTPSGWHEGGCAIGHIAIDAAVLARSVDRLINTNVPSYGDFWNAYDLWRERDGRLLTTGLSELGDRGTNSGEPEE